MLRSRWLRCSLILLLMLLLLAAGGLLYARHWLAQQGVSQLDWQGLGIGAGGLRLQGLQLEQREPASGRHVRLQLHDLQLDWTLTLDQFQIQRLYNRQLSLQLLDAGQPSTDESSSLPALPDWLPLAIEMPAIDLRIPCPTGQCRIQAALQGQRPAGALLPASLDLQLQDGAHSASLQAKITGPLQQAQLSARLQLDQQPWLQLDGQMLSSGPPLQLHGRLQLPARQPVPWLTDWLRPWSAAAADALAQLPDDLQLDAGWQLALQQDEVGEWQLPQITLDLRASLPDYSLAAIRLRESELQLPVSGSWQAGNLQLAIDPGSRLRIGRLQQSTLDARDLQIDPSGSQLAFSAEGGLQAQSAGRLQLASLQQGTLQAGKLSADLGGFQLDGERWQFRPDKPVKLISLQQDALQLSDLELTFDQLQLQGSSDGLQASGAAELQIQRLRHPQLRRQGWTLRAAQPAGAPGQRLQLQLGNDVGLRWAGVLDLAADGSLSLKGGLPSMDLSRPGALSGTLRNWPSLLSVSAGVLELQTSARRSAAGRLQAEVDLRLQSVSGVYDRSELTGINARLRASLDGERIKASIPQFDIVEINPGIPVGPVQMEGDYSARLNAPLKGKLRVGQLEAKLLGGSVRMIPDSIDFSDLPQQFAAAAYGLDIREMLRLYPAEGLNGSGLLDGYLPVILTRKGVVIDNGHLTARAPGGVMQLRSPGIVSLGRSNPAMQLVVKALDDFRYSLLSSSLSLSAEGQMLLGLKLGGSNPALEDGRVVNLNINLEENLPALLTSVQLSGRVNDIISERLQQRLQPEP